MPKIFLDQVPLLIHSELLARRKYGIVCETPLRDVRSRFQPRPVKRNCLYPLNREIVTSSIPLWGKKNNKKQKETHICSCFSARAKMLKCTAQQAQQMPSSVNIVNLLDLDPSTASLRIAEPRSWKHTWHQGAAHSSVAAGTSGCALLWPRERVVRSLCNAPTPRLQDACCFNQQQDMGHKCSGFIMRITLSAVAA